MTDRYEYDDILYMKQRKVKQWTVILILLLILTVCIRMRIDTVVVQGNNTYTAEEAENLIFSDYWDRNTVLIVINKLRNKKKDLPFVEDYDIVLKSPFSCELRFYEKKPIGCIRYMSNYMYFDKDGKMIESSPKRLDGIPVIEGLQFGYVVLGKELPVDNSLLLTSIMSVTQQLSLYNIGCDSINFSDSGTITISLSGGDVDVYLGTDDGTAAKISVLNDMLPEIRQKAIAGTLDLSTYDDEEKGAVSSFKLKEGSSIQSQTETASDEEETADGETGNTGN